MYRLRVHVCRPFQLRLLKLDFADRQRLLDQYENLPEMFYGGDAPTTPDNFELDRGRAVPQLDHSEGTGVGFGDRWRFVFWEVCSGTSWLSAFSRAKQRTGPPIDFRYQ